jgi:uncharacterized protein involved in exopolysaccharide biosynthesis
VLVTPVSYGDSAYLGLPVPQDEPHDPSRVLQTAASMLDSPAAASLAARRLGHDWSAGRVRAAVAVEPQGQSNVVAVQANERGRRLAVRIADTFVSAALEQRRQDLRRRAARLIAELSKGGRAPRAFDRLYAVRAGIDPTFSPLHSATTPGSATGAAAWQILALALLAGIVVGTGAALVSERIARRARVHGDVVELPDHSSPPATRLKAPTPPS